MDELQRRDGHGPSIAAAFLLATVLPVLAFAADRSLPAPRAEVTISPLMALRDFLLAGSPPDRVHFASIALEELARSYDAEVFTEDPEDKLPGDDRSTDRWRSAAHGWAMELLELRDTLGEARDVLVLVDPGQVMRLVIGERSVMIESPRLGADAELEQRIVGRYCAIALCPPLDEAPVAGGDGRARSRASWSFGRGQPPLLETSTGLHFRFRALDRLPERRAACLALVTALEDAALRLGWFHARGLPVDWPMVHLARLPESGLGAIVVNASGDYLALTVPWRALPREPLRDWLRARMNGSRHRHIFDDAERIFDDALVAAAAPRS